MVSLPRLWSGSRDRQGGSSMRGDWYDYVSEVVATLRLLLEVGVLDWEQDEVLAYLDKPWKWDKERTRALRGKKGE